MGLRIYGLEIWMGDEKTGGTDDFGTNDFANEANVSPNVASKR
jgi:hypothetical protein